MLRLIPSLSCCILIHPSILKGEIESPILNTMNDELTQVAFIILRITKGEKANAALHALSVV